MASLKEITYNVKNIIEGGRSTSDSPFSLREIAFFVVYYRALLIRRESDNFKRIDEVEQDLGLLSTEISQQSVGKANEIPKVILRTAKKIPSPVRMRKRAPFTYIGSPDLDEVYQFSEVGNARYQKYNKYTANVPRSFFHDGRLYITSDKAAGLINNIIGGASLDDVDESVAEKIISTIRVKGIFEDPREAWSFRHRVPYEWDQELPGMPQDLIQRITQSLLNGEASVIMAQVLDTETDRLPINQQPDDNEEGRS